MQVIIRNVIRADGIFPVDFYGARMLKYTGTRCASVAQSVEQLIRNQQVASSSLATSSKERAPVRRLVLSFCSCPPMDADRCGTGLFWENVDVDTGGAIPYNVFQRGGRQRGAEKTFFQKF